MKLKESFVTHISGDEQVIVDTTSAFVGLIRSNRTAAFIVECLKQETTADGIVDQMTAKYDAPRDVIERDVLNILETLRKVGALDE